MLTTTRWCSNSVHGTLALLCAVDEPLVATGVLWAALHRCHELVPKSSAMLAPLMHDEAALGTPLTHGGAHGADNTWGGNGIDAFRSMHTDSAHAWGSQSSGGSHNLSAGWGAQAFRSNGAAHNVQHMAHSMMGLRACDRLLEVYSLCFGTFARSGVIAVPASSCLCPSTA